MLKSNFILNVKHLFPFKMQFKNKQTNSPPYNLNYAIRKYAARNLVLKHFAFVAVEGGTNS